MASDEQTKRYAMFAIVAFNIAVMLMIWFAIFRRGMAGLGLFDFFLAVVVGLVVAGATYFAALKLNL